MDPIAAIATAIVAGVSLGLKDNAAQAVKDAYKQLRALLRAKHPELDATLSDIEENHAPDEKRALVTHVLRRINADDDTEIAAHAAALLDAIGVAGTGGSDVIGVDLEDLTAASVTLRDVRTTGSGAKGVRIRGARLQGDLTIEGVTAQDTKKKT